MVNYFIALISLLLLNQRISKDNNPREILNFDKGWTFQLGESIGAEQPGFNDSAWLNSMFRTIGVSKGSLVK